MLNAYMIYNKYRVAEIKLEIGYRHEARTWANKQYKLGISVFIGRYSPKFCKWRWIRYIPRMKINSTQIGVAQPTPYRSVNNTIATR